MRTSHNDTVAYQLPLDDSLCDMNALLGQRLKLVYGGDIHCCHCGRKTKKSFNQGYCYPCFQKLAQCDSCIVSPEKCHYDAGTCREPEWGETHCLTDHIVYLANSSGAKVGITRQSQVPVRWMDQGAIQALPIFRVATRRLSGLLEVILKDQVADKTNWRTMLKGDVDYIDLVSLRDQLLDNAWDQIVALQREYGVQAVQFIEQAQEYDFRYPVDTYPKKVVSFNLDKEPEVEGVLQGIKGQYLIFDTGVINMRKFGAYHIELYRAA
ncbi:DUF2797 domain-containing protein [Pseudomaricurvus sp. HS19]|uniref:DUF2797 domain-containing protein n=1 Tax=Pseudomaricurvus sp. HS19 TaxID=2692626 RepID=UPI001370B9E5|nr:DUF2797 domain-containing protein [Pseudomaricurvus sp. HS19]MYM62459.1 DUF2797 domain-containing protein [Pseudomaricurvus sp. HS19]